MSINVTSSPLPASIAVVGGIVAQAAPTSNLGVAGLIASITGLVVAGFQYFKAFLDFKKQEKELAELQDKLKRYKEVIGGLQRQLHEESLHRARLEGQLGTTEKAHVAAINQNADNVTLIAGHLDPPIDVQSPHVEPVLGLDPDDSPTGDFTEKANV
jgi:hypothetical protein